MNLQQERDESAKRMEVIKQSLVFPSYEEFRSAQIDAYKEHIQETGKGLSVEDAKDKLEKIEFLIHIIPDEDKGLSKQIGDDWAVLAVVLDYLLTKG